MKNSLILPLLFVCSFGRAQEATQKYDSAEVNTTLVNNQLSPEMVKLENVTGFGSGNLTSEGGKVVNRFQQSIFNFAAFPAALINQKRKQLYMGVGYMKQHFSSFRDAATEGPFAKDIQSFYIGTAFTAKLGNRTFWLTYAQTGLNGTKPFNNTDKTFNLVLINKLNYKVRRNLNLGVGVAYFSNMGNPLVLPALTCVYSTPKFVFNFDFPLKTEIEGILAHGRLRPVAGLTYHGGTYYLNDSRQYLYNFGALGYVGLRVKVMDFLYLSGAYQQGVYDQYKAGSIRSLSSLGVYAGQSQWVISLNVQVAKFVPLRQR